MNKSIEQIAHDYSVQVMKTRNKIIDDFYIAYAAQLSALGHDVSLQDICLIEQVGIVVDGHMTSRYWFEYKPKIDLKDEEK